MFAVRILLGLIKGVVIGGLLGGGLWYMETGGNIEANETSFAWLRWPLYGVIGLITGIVAGKPPWAKGAWVTSIVKGIVGFGLCVGLFFLADFLLTFDFYGRVPTSWYFAFGAILAVIYAVWVELDDGGKAEKSEEKKKE